MEKKHKMMILGGVIAVLAIVVIYLNFIAGGPTTSPDVEQALKAAEQDANAPGSAPVVDEDPKKAVGNIRRGGGR